MEINIIYCWISVVIRVNLLNIKTLNLTVVCSIEFLWLKPRSQLQCTHKYQALRWGQMFIGPQQLSLFYHLQLISQMKPQEWIIFFIHTVI